MTEEQKPASATGESSTTDSQGLSAPESAAASETVRADAAKPKKRGGSVFLAILALLVGGAALALAALNYQQGGHALRETRTKVEAIDQRLKREVRGEIQSLEDAQQRQSETLANNAARLQTMEKSVTGQAEKLTQIAEQVQGGRRGLQLMEVEYLLLTANDRLQLAGDVKAALRALELADERIGGLSEPNMLKVRKQIIDEIAALKALPRPDVQKIALTLNNLIARAQKLPLRIDLPEPVIPGQNKEDIPPPQAGWQGLLSRTLAVLKDIVRIRDNGELVQPLLPPDQEFFLRHNLILQLESAHLALLQKNTEAYRYSIKRAAGWFTEFYDRDNPEVRAAIQQLQELEREDLTLSLPDISGSLALLRGRNLPDKSDKETADKQQGEAKQEAAK